MNRRMNVAGILLAIAIGTTATVAAGSGEQIEHGEAVFVERCAACHGARMQGLDVSPPLRAAAFASEWRGRSVADLAKRIRATMPLNAPGTLDAAQTAAVTAAVLKSNDLLPADTELPEATPDQKKIIIGS